MSRRCRSQASIRAAYDQVATTHRVRPWSLHAAAAAPYPPALCASSQALLQHGLAPTCDDGFVRAPTCQDVVRIRMYIYRPVELHGGGCNTACMQIGKLGNACREVNPNCGMHPIIQSQKSGENSCLQLPMLALHYDLPLRAARTRQYAAPRERTAHSNYSKYVM